MKAVLVEFIPLSMIGITFLTGLTGAMGYSGLEIADALAMVGATATLIAWRFT